MSLVTFAVTFADVPGFPLGSVVDHLVLTITDPSGVATSANLQATATTATAQASTPGDYTASLQAVDSANTPLGAPVSASFSISAPSTVTLSIPSALSASVT